jgi:hypothetical protein
MACEPAGSDQAPPPHRRGFDRPFTRARSDLSFRFFRTDRIQTAVAKGRYSVRRVDLLRDLKVHLQKLSQQHP